MTKAITSYGVFCDNTLDATFHLKADAEKHSKEMAKDGYVMKTIAVIGQNGEDALDYISRDVFGMMKSLSPKVKAHIVATFGVEFTK